MIVVAFSLTIGIYSWFMDNPNYVSEAITYVGIHPLARACDVSPSAVHRWKVRRRLPDKGITGQLPYAKKIEVLSKRKYTAKRIREASLAVATQHQQ